MRLESGPALYDRMYFLGFLILCIGLGGYFYYDYTIGYPAENIEQAHKVLQPLLGSSLDTTTFPERPTKNDFDAMFAAQPATTTELHAHAGFEQPLFTRQADTSNETVEYHVSQYGYAPIKVAGTRVVASSLVWNTWFKTKEEIQLQFWFAMACAAVGLFALHRFYRASTLRAMIDDEGMTYGSQRIPFTAMNSLQDYSRKGWVDLYYGEGDQRKKLRIDNQKILKFDEIITALCEAKGFEDPRPPAEEEEAAPAPNADAAATEDAPARDDD